MDSSCRPPDLFKNSDINSGDGFSPRKIDKGKRKAEGRFPENQAAHTN
jgi:hypothetical protein